MGTGINALAGKIGVKNGDTAKKVEAAKKEVAPQKSKSSTKPAPKPAKPTRKSSGKRGHTMDELRPKILAMEKSGKSLTAIAEDLGLSTSYVWVIARNYKYDPDASAKKKKAPKKGKAEK